MTVDLRSAVRTANRLVVKVGSSSLTLPEGGLDQQAVARLSDVLAELRLAGRDVVLVSSGAIAAGLAPLGLAKRPRDLATQQAAASVGQSALMAAYTAAFARHDLVVGQVLLTSDDVTRRGHYTNARRTLERLFSMRGVPIVNENDTVATHEIRFGDNDRLAALVAHLISADALVLLSDVDALYDGPPTRPGTSRIDTVLDESELAGIDIGGTGSGVGTGGMVTKVEAARIAAGAGVTTVLTSAPNAGRAVAGESVGTVFAPQTRTRRARHLWLAHATTPRGRLMLDDGAVAAVVQRGKSLLPAGIRSVTGKFAAGDAVDVCTLDGVVVARGLVNYDSHELPALLGRGTKELAAALGPEYEREVMHRDDLVVLRKGIR